MSITRGSLKYKVPLVISFLSTASVYKKNTPFVHGRCNLLSAHAYRQIFTFFVHVTAIAPGPIWHAKLKDNGASQTVETSYGSLLSIPPRLPCRMCTQRPA